MPRYDVHIQLIDPSQQEAGLNFTFGRAPVIAVRGPQKLANRFLMTLLRRKGSDPVDPEVGTHFSELIGGNNLTETGDLQAILLEYVDDAADQVRAVDLRSSWLDADERLRTAEMTSFTQLREDAFEAWITLTTVSGAQVQMLIPVARI